MYRPTIVSADKSNLFHYRPSANCSKSADDQGRLYPVNQKATEKKCQTATHTVSEENLC